MWIRENMPEIYKKMHKWVCMEDYVIFCLSGEYATDCTIANRTMVMNIESCSWSGKMLEAAGISQELLPPICKSGTIVGHVTRKTSENTFLKEGTPVITGGHDHLCAALALGVIVDGDVFDSMGTAETITAIKDSIEVSRDMFYAQFNIGRYVDGGRFYLMGGMQSSGASIEWFSQNFIESGERGGRYEILSQMAGDMKDEPSGILFLPHMRGSGPPNVNPLARGCFIGLNSMHNRADMLKAIYEGTSYEFRFMKDSLAQLCSMKVDRLKIGGGGTKNSCWMKTKANVLGIDLDIPEVEESAAMGAAILAGIGLGVYADGRDAAAKLRITHRYIQRDEQISSKYDYLYRNGYKKLYTAINPINEASSAVNLNTIF
jgi:xylulokinase